MYTLDADGDVLTERLRGFVKLCSVQVLLESDIREVLERIGSQHKQLHDFSSRLTVEVLSEMQDVGD